MRLDAPVSNCPMIRARSTFETRGMVGLLYDNSSVAMEFKSKANEMITCNEITESIIIYQLDSK